MSAGLGKLIAIGRSDGAAAWLGKAGVPQHIAIIAHPGTIPACDMSGHAGHG